MKTLPALLLLLLLGAGCGSKGASASSNPGSGIAGASSQNAGSSSGGVTAASGNGAGATAGAGMGGAGTGGATEPPFTSDELLINGDAEQGLTGWTSAAANTAIVSESYGAADYLGAADPGPKSRGNAFFRGSDNLSVDAHQVVDVTPFADQIQRGARFKLSAYLGGYLGQDDHAAVVINLLSADGALLESSTLGGPLAAERMSITGLVGCSLDGKLPEATRRIDVHLVMRRAGGTGNDGYADNLSLVLHN